MKNRLSRLLDPIVGLACIPFMSALVLVAAVPASAAEAAKTRVLVVTGGHDFERPQFNQLFKDNPDITFEMLAHPKADEQLQPEAAKAIDVLVLYDHWQDITPETKTNFLNFLAAGKGLVALHHSLCDYQAWPEFEKIVGGKYYLQKTIVNGVEKPRSIYKHGVKIPVRVADSTHPVTKGVDDFEILDETYGLFDVSPDVHVLLTTDEPTSGKTIGWVKEHGKARVAYIELGHDHTAYENPNYRRLVAQAIRWAARKD